METYNNVLKELLKNKKKNNMDYCKDCGEGGHKNNISTKCIIKIHSDNELRNNIKQFVLRLDITSEHSEDEILEIMSKKFNTSKNRCKKLYSEIPAEQLLDRNMDISAYLENMEYENCYECNKKIIKLHKNTNRLWKHNNLCDKCWCNHEKDMEQLWTQISEYKNLTCNICKTTRTRGHNERFHYDHLNMFDKGESICNLVNEGYPIEEIYNEIDKCQILCISCHHIVTDIEKKLPFTRIKSSMTKKLNSKEITQQEYDEKVNYHKSIYKDKMLDIYETLKLHIQI